jgi:hypothetical protein
MQPVDAISSGYCSNARLPTFSPNRFLTSSKSSIFRNVVVLHFLIHSLLKVGLCKGNNDYTSFHSPCLGLMPAPPSAGQLVIIR